MSVAFIIDMKSYKSFFLKIFLTSLSVCVPAVASAQASFTLAGQNFAGVIAYILDLISIINPILSILALIVFFWGLSKFILTSGNPVELAKGKQFMFWGIIALFVLIAFQSIVGLIATDLGLGSEIPTTGSTGSILPTNVQ